MDYKFFIYFILVNYATSAYENYGDYESYEEDYDITLSDEDLTKIEPEPVTKEPDFKEPIVKDPFTKDPVKKDPVIKDPFTRDPFTEDPVIKDPFTEYPVKKDPVIKEPVKKDPVIKDPITKDPVTKDSAIKDPVTKDPGIKDPVTKDPVIKNPVTKDPVTKYPVTKEPKSYQVTEIVSDIPDKRTLGPIVVNYTIKKPLNVAQTIITTTSKTTDAIDKDQTSKKNEIDVTTEKNDKIPYPENYKPHHPIKDYLFGFKEGILNGFNSIINKHHNKHADSNSFVKGTRKANNIIHKFQTLFGHQFDDIF